MLSEFIQLFWPACLFVVVLMAFIWWLALRVNNLGIVDVAWSYAFAPIALYFGFAAHGDPVRRGLIAGMVTVWSLRLGTHVCTRVVRHHPREDARYGELRSHWQENLAWKVFVFFQMQAASIAVLVVPFLLAAINPSPGIAPVEWCGVALAGIAVLGESVADWQLRRFLSRAENRGRICRDGLWNYSRHPNYFFEWLIWVAFFLFALGSPLGCTTIYCPALMLYLLLRVTGIPLTEKLSVKNKGAAYEEYQRTTSAFVPWFKKSLS